MYKSIIAGLRLYFIATMFLFGCGKKEETLEPVYAVERPTAQSSEALRTEFAKTLVKAMQDKEVRAFLKQSALEKYDGDYDIMYAFVKDKKLASGKTFEQILVDHSSADLANQWTEKEPLMTIFIPSLDGFTPETWNVDVQIPHVAIDNSDLSEGKTTKFKAFDAAGQPYEIDAKKAPGFPVVAIKENERIIAKSKLNIAARRAPEFIEKHSNKKINENENHSFHFIGDHDPNRVSKKNSRLATYASLPDLLTWGSNVGYVEVQRDWIYYYISPKLGYDRGTKAPMYYEFIRGFKLANSAVLGGISDSWTEGSLEFHITVSFIYRGGQIQNDLKVFYCNRSDLMSGSTMIDYNPNVEIMDWDMQRYGDEWKFSILENDPGGSIQKTRSSQSTFGYNFEASSAAGALLTKIGLKFGTTGTFQKSNSEVTTINAQSDQLGDARFKYDEPIVLSYSQIGGSWYYTTNSVTNGSVEISIEPVAKWTDTRPIPD